METRTLRRLVFAAVRLVRTWPVTVMAGAMVSGTALSGTPAAAATSGGVFAIAGL